MQFKKVNLLRQFKGTTYYCSYSHWKQNVSRNKLAKNVL